MKTFFTSDTHFFHDNILKFDNRPYDTMEEMCGEMLKLWNIKVSKNDTVYILGDYTWKQSDECIEYLQKLNGMKKLILGNHDFRNASNKYKNLFESIKDYDDIKVTLENGKKKRCILSHYPIHFYNGHYHDTIMLFGHVHDTRENDLVMKIAEQLNNLEDPCPVHMINVGCMHWNYEPVTLDEMLEK